MNARRPSETPRRVAVLRYPLHAMAFVAGATLLVLAACGLNTHGAGTGGGGGGGDALPCNVNSQCDDQNPCTTDSCGPDKTCLFAGLDGVPSPVQTAGDCLTVQCVKGEPVSKPDDADIPNDHNDCTIDSCNLGVASHVPKGLNTICDKMGSAGECDAQGVCEVSCMTAAQCVSTNPCVTLSCDASKGHCVPNNLPDGTPTPGVTQTPGDCHVHICLALMGMPSMDVNQIRDIDVPKTATDCDTELCDNGVPSNPPVAIDTPCNTFTGNMKGFCDGTPASPTCRQCASAIDCPGPIDDCKRPACDNFACTVAHTPAGMPVAGTTNPPQIVGDCQRLVCDGMGGTMNVADATDPHDDGNVCTTDTCAAPFHTPVADGAVCGNGLSCKGGICNGCTVAKEAMQCPPASCAGTVLTRAETCDLMANCNSNGTQDCGPYLCGPSGTTSACTTKCNNIDTDCAQPVPVGNYCTGPNGACLPKLAQGSPCGGAHQCQSNFCIDGLCCNIACAGCFACSNAKTGGTSGTCTAVTTGTNPNGACTDMGAVNCGTTGFCANGACALYAAGTTCVAASCIMSGTTVSAAHTCNGTGTCITPVPPTVGCVPYVCASNACLTTCNADTDCSQAGMGDYCTGPGGTCVARLAGGGACATANQCQSGFCVDGFCCNNACNTACQACAASKKLSNMGNGTCGNATNAVADPRNLCGTSPPCGNDGLCNGGVCEKVVAGTTCQSATCVGTTSTAVKQCDGLGACSQGGSQTPCGNSLVCDPVAMTCYASCGTGAGASDLKCVSGDYCDGSNGTCKSKILNGGSGCAANSQCQSGACGSNGVCCGAACTLSPPCGNDGTCAPGTGACQKAAAATSCAAPSCSASTAQAHACDGTGVCVITPTVCDPLNCDPAAGTCFAACGTSNAKCAAGYACDGMGAGTCKLANGGMCSSSAVCASGVCGTMGSSGKCCTATCPTAGVCGATSCNGTGACVSPSTATACNACTGSTLTPGNCSGTGTCTAGTGAACANNLRCQDATTCWANCMSGPLLDDTKCASGTCQLTGFCQ